MSAVTHDVVIKSKSRKKRRKSVSALRKIRNALARRKLEEMHEEELLQEQIYDVFADTNDGK
jgi:ribosomal protein L10